MRKVIFAINMSIDGFVGHMSLFPDEEVYAYFHNLKQEVDLIAYGRKMYEIMFPYWALEENRDDRLSAEFGEWITGIDKIVFSRTLKSADYNTRVVHNDPVAELLRLKQLPGKNISIGSVSMLPELAMAGVIDEYRLAVNPVFVGQGPRLMESGNLADRLQLKLVDSKAFKSGALALTYLKS